MTENEFLLQDRIAKIRSVNEQHDLLNNAYISFSGGKDSTVLSHLMDEALPGNKIPRLFLNTGIEYGLVLKFVREVAEKDDRIHIYTVGKNIRKTLDEVGYPFKSKEHAQRVHDFKHCKKVWDKLLKYFGLMDGDIYQTCPKILRYQITDECKLNISDRCCFEFKKKPVMDYMKESGKFITITGIMRTDKGLRSNINCVSFDKNNKLKKFHPMAPLNPDFEKWYIETRNIKLCELYYPPYNFLGTGCKGCPFNPNLEEDLFTLGQLLPNERKQCEYIWKPVYDEYRRIGYRLSKIDEDKLFDW